MSTNRPYLFELATLIRTARINGEDLSSLRDVAAHNNIDLAELDRASSIVDALAAEGTDLDEWVRREYIIDGWLHGWLSPQASFNDPALTSWKLSQYAYDYYSQST